MGLQELRSKIIQVQEAKNKVLAELIQEEESILININTQQQLFKKGQDRFKNSLKMYKPSTVRIKKRKGQPTNRTTLKDTGNFYKSMRVVVSGDKVIVRTSVAYDKYLIAKYGKDILGFQRELINDFLRRYFVPKMKRYIEQ